VWDPLPSRLDARLAPAPLQHVPLHCCDPSPAPLPASQTMVWPAGPPARAPTAAVASSTTEHWYCLQQDCQQYCRQYCQQYLTTVLSDGFVSTIPW